MNKSESIAHLAAALAKVQAEIQDAHKDKQGYGYKYADLSAVLEIARPLLSKNELAVTQLTGNADQSVTVETVLMHSSGEWMSGEISMPVQVGKGMSQAQAVGSVVTYARRYSLAAIIGFTQTDNDASLKTEPAKPDHEDDETNWRKVSRRWVQNALPAAVAAIEAEDALALREMFAEINKQEQTALWRLLDSRQQEEIRRLERELKETEA